MKQPRSLSITTGDGIALEAALHETEHSPKKALVVQVHGITVDMDEGGMFVRLAEKLTDAGFDVLRFSFRGHGRSTGQERGMTIAGEMLDLAAALKFAMGRLASSISIVAASFGAVATCLSLHQYRAQIDALVLWNPVLDLQRTFIHPETPWGQDNFSQEAVAKLRTEGILLIDDEFELGWVAYDEIMLHDPLKAFLRSQVPSLIIHGDADTYIPYSVSSYAAKNHAACEMLTIEGSDHGFDTRAREDQAIEETVRWLNAFYSRANTDRT